MRTSLKPDPAYQELGVRTVGFKEGTKVFVTLPGGKRETFTFKPVLNREIEQLLKNGAFIPPALWFYNPAFVSEKGVTSTLSVNTVQLSRNANTGEYSVVGTPYHPADVTFGGGYTLTTKEGMVYQIDGTTGDLLTATDTNGNKLTFTDGGIFSDTGKEVTFGRDARGRITSVTDPMGLQVKYQYDEWGDLVKVIDREKNATEFVYDEPQRQHFLTEVIDPLGRTGAKTEYDEKGRLKQLVDVNGKPITMSYDLGSSTQTVTDQLGYATTYVYDERGNITQELDARNGLIVRTYDEDNNLLTETDADGVTTEYTYDERRNLLTIKDEDGNITRMAYDNRGHATSIVSPTGLTVTAKYDSRGNLIESTDTNGLLTKYTYNSQGQLRFQTAPDGQVTEFDYDRFGNPNRMVDSRGNEVKANYDLNGRVQAATSTFNLNGQTYTLGTEYIYDDEGRTIGSTTSQGNSQSMTYDALGRVTSMTDIFGNVTSYRYDLQTTQSNSNTPIAPSSRSVVTRIDEITLPDNTPNNSSDNPKVIKKYDQANRLIVEVSPTGLETRYLYDELGRLAETILPDFTPLNWDDNPRSKTEYSAASRITAQTDIYGNREEYFYNDLGQLSRFVDVLKNETTYTYNKGGLIESVTDPRKRTTRYVYDGKARLLEAIFFDNSRYQLTYDQLGRVKTETNELNQTTTYEYNAYSQVSAVINALNERTEFEYDHRRNLILLTDALNHSTHYKYDQYGRKVETTFHTGDKILMGYDQFSRLTSVTDENQHATHYTYNNLSQLTQIEQPNHAKTNYIYDNFGRLRQIKDANQWVTEFEYDDFYRTTATILPMGQRNQTVYDKFGQVSSETDFNGDTINYTYDSLGRLERKSFTDPRVATVSYTYDPVTSQLKTVTDGRGVTQYNYDTRDRLQEILSPDSQFVRYGYDLLSNITSLTTPSGTTSYGYDALNRLDTVTDSNRLLANYDYDKAGNLIQTQFANGSLESRRYDTRNRLTEVTTKNVTGTLFSGFTYTLDPAGNRKRVVEHDGRIVDYTYDELNRLTQETITDGFAGNRTIGYSYDLVGNRLTRNDSVEGLTTYTYDRNNRLKDATSGTFLTQFTYDNNGSLRQRSDGTQTITYDWINDGENRLVGVTLNQPSGTSQAQYIYDAFGNRVASIADGVRTNYLVAPIWNLPQVLMEYDASGQVTADYTQGMGLVRSRQGNREAFYHTDGLGSTRALTDSVGLVTDRYTYDAFGELLNRTGTFGNSFQFAGEQRDAQTGLDYLRARYYDADLGRFISKDAFSGLLSDPYSQHDYQYAHANPVRYTDPSGYFTLGDVLNTITVASELALIGSTSFAAGYITGGVLSGADSDDILQMFGDFGAGFASGVSGGYLTDVYEAHTGQKVEPQHGMLWGAGNIAGISTSFLVGMKLPTYAATTIGPLKWVAVAGMGMDTGFDIYGAATATVGLADGKWEQQDAWNLLNYVPFVGMIGGIKKGIGAAREVKKAASSMDAKIASTSKAFTEIGSESPPPRPPACFVAGTEILTTEGEKDIEDIQVGDWVIADDPTTPGEIEARQVLETFVRHTDKLVDLYIDGEVISTTGEHPFWTPDNGWVEAKDLAVGSQLQTEDGKIIDVDRIEKREGDFTVYNFKVEGFHTYFVSQHHVLVHNADCTSIAKKFRKNRPGGQIITIKSADGGILPDPPNMRPDDAPWFYHDVYVRDGLVYDPMGFGDELGKTGIPFDDWIKVYGSPDNLVITDGPARGK